MKKLCFIAAETLCVMILYTTQSYAAIMTADEFKSTVQSLSQQNQEKLTQEVKKNIPGRVTPDTASVAQPTSPAATTTQAAPPPPSQPGNNRPYTGFGNSPKPAAPTTTPPSNSGSGWNPYQ